MLTPQQLYETYSSDPCSEEAFFATNPLYGSGPYGNGTPHYMKRVVQFMRHLKYPCIRDTPNFLNIRNTGSKKIGLPFKFLESIDIEFFKEIQPTIKSGTAHSIRNACDISRICALIGSRPIIEEQEDTAEGESDAEEEPGPFTSSEVAKIWHHRMSTEYITYFGSNSLSDCLMVLGPDLIAEDVAYDGRAPNIGYTYQPGGSLFVATSSEEQDFFKSLQTIGPWKGMGCLPREKDFAGATGANWACVPDPSDPLKPKCRSCAYCDEEKTNDPCCDGDTPARQNLCCGAPRSTRADFGLLINNNFDTISNNIRPTQIYPLHIRNFNDIENIDDITYISYIRKSTVLMIINRLKLNEAFSLLDGSIYMLNPSRDTKGRWSPNPRLDIRSYNVFDYKLKHVGILPRNIYGGYANLLDNSGSNFYGIMDDIFLEYMQNINGYDYETDASLDDLTSPAYRTTLLNSPKTNILRARTISMLPPDPDEAVRDIKDLLWNGYGIVLFSNVGFPNTRDSSGLSYPDRMWYTTYSIIGYDDSLREFDQCVYVLHVPWGKWNEGGNPSWGPLPDGAFLVTEDHLKCMLKVYADRDYYNCRPKPCNPVLEDCEDPQVAARAAGCGGHGPENKCEPYFCASQQKAMGIAFAISLNEGFPEQTLDHLQWLPKRKNYELNKEQTLFYRLPD